MGMLTLKDINQAKLKQQNEPVNFFRRTKWKKKIISAHEIKKTKEETWKFFQKLGYIDSNRLYENYHNHFIRWWSGEPCVIIAASKSLDGFISKIGWDAIDGLHTMTINHVIEDYDRAECHFFLDKRFLQKTTYDIKNYHGIIFAQNTTGLKPAQNIVLFWTNNSKPTIDFETGLFCSRLSGLAALNLALIMGASPIYLLGFDDAETTSKNGYHYKNDYPGEQKNEKVFNKFQRVQKYFRMFSPWAKDIIVASDGKGLPPFRRINLDSFSRELKKIKTIKIEQQPKIAHISFTDDLNRHAAITRYAVKHCYGRHKIYKQDLKNIPQADLYILEHFQSTNNFVKRFPYKHKAIDIVHTVNCIPDNDFKKIIVLTESWKKLMAFYHIQPEKMAVINIGLDQKKYKNVWPDYDGKVFGRITRWSPGKIHPQWNDITRQILEQIPDSKCKIFTNNTGSGQRPFLKHSRMIYDNSCKINMFKGNFLKQLTIYAHVNGTFIDTFSHGVLEAMSSGLPIVLLQDKVGAVEEVAGDAAIICNSISAVKKEIIGLLEDKNKRIEYGKKSKVRANKFHYRRMVEKINGVIKQCVR